MSGKANAYHRYLNEDYRSMTRNLNIPIKAIEEAGFNTKNPIYVRDLSEDEHLHLILTQDGSCSDIIRSVNGWKRPDGKKTYRLGMEKLVGSNDIDSVMVTSDKLCNYVDIVGLKFT